MEEKKWHFQNWHCTVYNLYAAKQLISIPQNVHAPTSTAIQTENECKQLLMNITNQALKSPLRHLGPIASTNNFGHPHPLPVMNRQTFRVYNLPQTRKCQRGKKLNFLWISWLELEFNWLSTQAGLCKLKIPDTRPCLAVSRHRIFLHLCDSLQRVLQVLT